MNLLLDSHAFLWFCLGEPKLSRAALQTLLMTEVVRWITIASLWELNIKASLGKLTLHRSLESVTDDAFQRQGFRFLPIDLSHLQSLRLLPPHHRDPFDRMLIAQAQAESLMLVSTDALFDKYGVPRLW